jgi:hypothetical protein
MNDDNPDWPLESDGLDIPEWVNDGRSFFDCFVEAVHIALWEQQLEDQP